MSEIRVRDRMKTPVHSVRDGDKLREAQRLMQKHDVSALAVVDGTRRLCGVIGRTDLLRAGRVRVVEGTRDRLLTLPDAYVRQHMTPSVAVVTPDSSLRDAARRMVREHIHRIFVTGDRKPLGVVGSHEMLEAVAAGRNRTALQQLIERKVVSVNAEDPLSLAIDRMAAAHVSGVVVLEDRWPVGVFTHEDALSCRDAPPGERVEGWMSLDFLFLPAAIPAHRAAALALARGTGRLLAVDGDELLGVVTPQDLARLIAEA